MQLQCGNVFTRVDFCSQLVALGKFLQFISQPGVVLVNMNIHTRHIKAY